MLFTSTAVAVTTICVVVLSIGLFGMLFLTSRPERERFSRSVGRASKQFIKTAAYLIVGFFVAWCALFALFTSIR